VRPVILVPEPDALYPLVDKPGILAGADMNGLIPPTRKREIGKRAAAAIQPGTDARAGRFKKLELNGSASLALDDNGT
jgi:hypothetical protein